MIVKIKVIPNAGKNEVIKEGEILKVKVSSPPSKGKANKEVIELLANFFEVKKNCIRIIKGEKSREKIIEIL
ncbi:MAG: DUF167 domain-containing protein [Thermoplasmatales archaeon]|nr:DUF167 domain-containing protein [Thermoplasmatales archaeon]